MARPRKFDEDAVIVAARERFWHRGYEGTSMSDLCEATGVASQSLYGAFGSKHELFVRTLEDYCRSQVSGLKTSEENLDSPWTWLMAAIVFDDGGRIGLGEDGCYLSGSAAALARLDGNVESASRRTYSEILKIFKTALRRARDQGELQDDADIDQAALALLTAMQGIEFLRKSGISGTQFVAAKKAAVTSLSRAYAKKTSD